MASHIGKFAAAAFALLPLASPAPSRASDPHRQECPDFRELRVRPPATVLRDHLAAFVAADVARLGCDYQEEAVLVLPGSVAHGPEEIMAAFSSFFAGLGGPGEFAAKSTTIGADTILLEWTLTAPRLVIRDGVDSFVVRRGQIARHTVHLGGMEAR